jgi:hypothetical protein
MATMLTRRLLMFAGAAGLLPAAVGAARADNAAIFTGLVRGTALGGYDAVAYLTDRKAVEGSPAITTSWKGATWRFASTANRDAFVADPDRYAPAYGGHCAWAAAQGYRAKGDPRAWSIVDGRLFLNYDARVKRTWDADQAALIRQGDANWPRLTGK